MQLVTRRVSEDPLPVPQFARLRGGLPTVPSSKLLIGKKQVWVPIARQNSPIWPTQPQMWSRLPIGLNQ